MAGCGNIIPGIGSLKQCGKSDFLCDPCGLSNELETLKAENDRLRGRRFPLQKSYGTDAPKNQRASVPWAVGQMAWDVYGARYPGQSCERIAERGGFGNAEMDSLLPGWREITDKVDTNASRAEKAEQEMDAAIASKKVIARKYSEAHDLLAECHHDPVCGWCGACALRHERGKVQTLTEALEKADGLADSCTTWWDSVTGLTKLTYSRTALDVYRKSSAATRGEGKGNG